MRQFKGRQRAGKGGAASATDRGPPACAVAVRSAPGPVATRRCRDGGRRPAPRGREPLLGRVAAPARPSGRLMGVGSGPGVSPAVRPGGGVSAGGSTLLRSAARRVDLREAVGVAGAGSNPSDLRPLAVDLELEALAFDTVCGVSSTSPPTITRWLEPSRLWLYGTVGRRREPVSPTTAHAGQLPRPRRQPHQRLGTAWPRVPSSSPGHLRSCRFQRDTRHDGDGDALGGSAAAC